MIEAITFDFWATLYRPVAADYEARRQRLRHQVEALGEQSFDPEVFAMAVNVARVAWDHAWTKEYRTMGAAEWLGIVVAELGLTPPTAALAPLVAELENGVLDEPPTLVPELLDVLPKLAAQYKLAIISDTGLSPGRVLRRLLEQDGVLTYFSAFSFSDETGYSKPHAEAFAAALDGLEVDPAQACHIGDLLRTDVAGALTAGMRAVQFVGINHDDSAVARPDAVISTHNELFALLEQWNGA